MAGMNVEKSIYNHLVDVMESRDKVVAEFKVERTKHKEEIKELKRANREEINRIHAKYQAELAAKQEEYKILEDKFRKLEAEHLLLKEELAKRDSNDHNNSSNSSLPPSTDQRPSKQKKAANEYNSRTKTGRKSGGQKGHPGKVLKLP